jgi:predicted O-methyltransferase YrrM
MRRITQFLQYLNYLYYAKNEHSVHSPFVYDLYTNIIKERKSYYIFSNIESVRSRLLLDTSIIQVTDYGTGNSTNRKVANIAAKSLKKPKTAELLFRLANHFKPTYLLELGTSLGITSAYLASVSPASQLTTLEGCPEIANIAQETFDTLKLSNTVLTIGAFENTLDKTLDSLPQLDFVFIDGNHKKGPTIQYFEACLKRRLTALLSYWMTFTGRQRCKKPGQILKTTLRWR